MLAQGGGSVIVREATYLGMLVRKAVNGLSGWFGKQPRKLS